MIKFKRVSKYKNADFPLPERKTANSAGYDIAVAEDTIVPPFYQSLINLEKDMHPVTLKEMAAMTSLLHNRPTLVSTGIKCYLDPDTYLELSVRSSTPLKYWLVMANGIGIIDADYCDNPDNEGEIFFQLINLTNAPIILHKGDIIGQGIVKHYLTTIDDEPMGERLGGFGSTTN